MGPRSTRFVLPFLALIAGAACSPDEGNLPDGGRRDARADGAGDTGGRDVEPGFDSGGVCTDEDQDLISDSLDGRGDNDRDGRPNYQDDDSDGDGFTDIDEARRIYPFYEAQGQPDYRCGQGPNNCDDDALPNFLDLDSDNDGLTDTEERNARTNPCDPDSDADSVPDLTEVVAGSDPSSGTSLPPPEALYVTLPYSTPAMPYPHETREFEFQTRLRAADIFFVVDTTGSMQGTIDTLRSTLTSRIIPGVVGALSGGDARYGVGDFRDVPNGTYGSTGDWILRVRQRLDMAPDLSLAAVNAMMASGGGDWPESGVEAMYQALEGTGIVGHESDTTPGLPTGGAGWAGVLDPARDCPGVDSAFGWACFREGRVPILVFFSDADWHNGYSFTYPYMGIRGLHSYTNLRDAMRRRGAYFVGIDVGYTRDTFTMAEHLARETNTVDGAGMPIVFNNPGGGPGIADSVVNAISTLASQTRQDITTRTLADPSETRIVSGRTTADFVKSVVPTRGIPDMPMGYERRDATTFYNVLPSTRVVFTVDFHNDFQPGTSTAQLFRANISVLGRAGAEVDRRPVFIIVPAENAGPPPG